MIPLSDAQQHVLDSCRPLAPAEVSVAEVTGLVLAAPVDATEDVPPFANSAVDGYAVRAADVAAATDGTPVELVVVDELAAGVAATRAVGPGEAIRIMTGAPVPPGADGIVMVERTERVGGGDRVLVRAPVKVGEAVRPAGDDVRAGQRVLEAGTLVRPAVAGVLASLNARSVLAVPRARVAVLSTGDELVDDGRPLAPGEIRESNRTMLLALVAHAGATPVDFGIVRDDEAALEAVLTGAAASCDAIVTSGGVSMGDYDVVKAVLARLADMRWMQIAIKPAKPFAFGMLHGTPVFGLPGNPVSSLVSFELLARPALRKIMGRPEPWLPAPVRALVDEDLTRRPDGKVHYARVRAGFAADGRLHVRPVAAQGSHQLAATALADGLAALPDGEGVRAGGEVDVVLLH